MKVYALSKSWIVFILVFSIALILGSLYYLILYGITDILHEPGSATVWLLPGLALICILFMSYAMIESINGKFVIENNRIYLVNSFGSRELLHSEIKGYRLDDKYIYIEPVSKDKKRILVSTYFSNTGEIVGWLNNKFPDLDQQEEKLQRKQILTDDNYGITRKDRVANLKRAKKMAKIVNIIGVVIAAAVIFLPEEAYIFVVAAIVAPLVFILIFRRYKGLIKLDQQKNSPYPSISFGVYGPIMVLMLKSLQAYNILNYEGIWIPAILIALFFFALIVIGTPEFKSRDPEKLWGMGVILALAFAYGFSVVVTLNCEYDSSTPNQYDAAVLEKSISGGKSKSYNLKLSPWGPRSASEEVAVSSALYDRLDTKKHVNVYHYQGRFGIPWFFVSDK